ncbi:MAG: large repetitive protein, partial [Verrucomicrobiota bacterium]
ANGRIDVFDKNYVLQPVANFPFNDPTIPTTPGNTFRPFNIQAIGGSLYVAYAKVGPGGLDEEGVGNGFVRRFNLNGVRDLTFGINNGPLNSPWGLTIAPATFGIFGGALLVGNFGEGNPSIHAFNPTTGAFLGTLQDESGNGIEIDELWALTFGNGGSGGDVNTLYFTAGIGEEQHGLLGSLKPTTASATSLIQFGDSEYTVGEGTGRIDVTVSRSGDVSNTATVNYATFDQSQPAHASQKSDYELAVGKLTFNPGETSKTFRILIVNDLFVEGDEAIDLFLSNPVGVGLGLGTPNHATVTIKDNDAVAPTTNPIDNSSFFVRQLYLDFLGREPEPGALSFLTGQIEACGTNTACRNERRVNVATAFFTSFEFHQTGYLIYLANKAAFKNAPAGAGTTTPPVLYGELLRDLQILNQGVPFGEPGWDGVLGLKLQGFFNDFVLRPAFAGLYPTTQTPAEFVDALYLNTGVTPSAAERQAAINEFGGAGDTTDTAARARALRRVTQNATFVANEFNRAFVFFEFAGFYRRHPDQAAYDGHVTTLNNANGDFRAAGMIKKFLDNDEYRQRFGTGAAPVGAGPSPTPGSQSLNISTRGRVTGGENVLIAGFIITGSGSKNVVLRAIGPSLTSSGISDGLADPVLELRTANGTFIASNDDWKTFQGTIPPNLAPTNDKESAIATSLAPGAYTATVSGKGPATGVALAEVYDVDSQPSTSALANISTRGRVQTGNDVLIGGFQLGGNSSGSLILARGGGPSLQNFGIASPLADPTIEFHDANGATLSANDNWRDTQELEVLYLGLPPTNGLEAAIVANRPAGPTTVIVEGKNGTTGVGLVEIFNFR